MTRARRLLAATLALLLGVALPRLALAQNWPDKPIRVVVPYAPGGLGDVLARAIAQKIGPALGQPIVIENKPGAAGMLGAAAVANAAPDGYTILLGYTSEMTVAPQMTRNSAYDTVRDFEPVALAGISPLLLVANPSTPGDSLKQFIAAAKQAPGKYSFATAGPGSPAQFAGEQLQRAAGIKLLQVPYKGGAQAVTDTLAGVVNIYFSGFPPALPQVLAGRLKAYAVTGEKRSSALPDVPTMTEAGLSNFDISGWFGFFVPKGTPVAIVKHLNAVITEAESRADLRASLEKQGVEMIPESPARFGAFVSSEQKKYGALIDQLGLREQ